MKMVFESRRKFLSKIILFISGIVITFVFWPKKQRIPVKQDNKKSLVALSSNSGTKLNLINVINQLGGIDKYVKKDDVVFVVHRSASKIEVWITSNILLISIATCPLLVSASQTCPFQFGQICLKICSAISASCFFVMLIGLICLLFFSCPVSSTSG